MEKKETISVKGWEGSLPWDQGCIFARRKKMLYYPPFFSYFNIFLYKTFRVIYNK